MAFMMKIQHVDQLKNGVLRFRRKFPKDVAEALNQPTLQVHIRNRDGLAFRREYDAILREFDRIVADTRDRLSGMDTRSPLTRWREALLKAEGLVAERTGLDDDEEYARHLIADSLAKRGGEDPLLIKALVNPTAQPPKVTLQDARKMYERDKRLTDKDDVVRMDRMCSRLEEALGPLDKFPVEALRREHAKRYMETLLATKKSSGEPLALGTCLREAKIIIAMINHALVEFELADLMKNPFVGLPWPKDDTRAVDKKMSLPDDLVDAVQARLDLGRTAELPRLWRLLKSTGMRLGEAAGLTAQDIDLDAETPRLHIRPNAIRKLKTASSERTIPLTGDGLQTAQEIVAEGLSGAQPVFARYARPRGSDAASAALMKAVRAETTDKRMTVHGLRHRVSDKFRDASAPVEVRRGYLGHANQSVAEAIYGSSEARLREFLRWALKAGL